MPRHDDGTEPVEREEVWPLIEWPPSTSVDTQNSAMEAITDPRVLPGLATRPSGSHRGGADHVVVLDSLLEGVLELAQALSRQAASGPERG